MIAPEEIDRMAAGFFESAYTILIPERTEVRFNGEWLGKRRLRRGRCVSRAP